MTRANAPLKFLLVAGFASCREPENWQAPNNGGEAGVGVEPSLDGGASAAFGGRFAEGGAFGGVPASSSAGEGGERSSDAGAGGDGGAGAHAGAHAMAGAGASSCDEAPPQCRLGTECTDASGAPECEYANPSPWLLFLGTFHGTDPITLNAIPSAFIEEDDPVLLHEFPEDFPVSDIQRWSPSGRFFVFDEVWTDLRARWHNRLMWAEFGRGLPGPPRPIPNLPKRGHYFIDDWDLDSDIMAVTTDAEAYVVRFGEGEPIASLALTSAVHYDVKLCRGAMALVYSTYDPPRASLVDLALDAGEPTELGTSALLSPDRRHVAVLRPSSPGENEVLVGPCELSAALTIADEIVGEPEELEWSPDSKHLLVVKDVAEQRVLEVFDVSALESGPVYESSLVERRSWSPDGRTLLLERDSAADRYALLDLESSTLAELPFEDDADFWWCGEHLLIDQSGSYDPRRRWVFELGVDARARLLFDESTGAVTEERCDPRGTGITYLRTTPTERIVEVVSLVRPLDAPVVLYRGSATEEITLWDLAEGERGLLASITRDGARDPEAWWVPMRDGELKPPGAFIPRAYAPTFQP